MTIIKEIKFQNSHGEPETIKLIHHEKGYTVSHQRSLQAFADDYHYSNRLGAENFIKHLSYRLALIDNR